MSDSQQTAHVASLQEVREFFGMNGVEFRQNWTKLTTEDKAQLRAGIGSGSLTY